MRIFAIGATVVLGKALVPLLVDRGHELTVMAPGRRFSALPPGVARVRGSLLDEGIEQRLTRALSAHDAVLNIATAMPRDFAAPAAWEANTRVRVDGTQRLTSAASSANVAHLVQMSITMAYADGGDTWLDEAAPFDADPRRAHLVEPVSALEAAIRALPDGRPRWTILRAGRFAGPGTIQDLHRRQLHEGALAVAGDERSFVSMVHVTDFAAAVVAAVEADLAANAVLNVCDEPVRLGPYLDRLACIDSLPAPRRAVERPPDLPAQRVDSSRSRRMLDWMPRRGIWSASATAR